MKKWLFLPCICILSCCSQKVITYLNPDASFEQFHTFRMVSTKLEGRKISPESTQIFEEIRNQISKQMEVRNYSHSKVKPDLILRYELSSASRTQSTNNNSAFNNTFGFQSYSVNSRNIHESILILELFDVNKKLIWQGSYDLKQERKEHQATKAIHNAIEQIFTTYPYIAGSKEINQELTSTKKTKND